MRILVRMRLANAVRVTNADGMAPHGVRSQQFACCVISEPKLAARSWSVPRTISWSDKNFSMASKVFLVFSGQDDLDVIVEFRDGRRETGSRYFDQKW